MKYAKMYRIDNDNIEKVVQNTKNQTYNHKIRKLHIHDITNKRQNIEKEERKVKGRIVK